MSTQLPSTPQQRRLRRLGRRFLPLGLFAIGVVVLVVIVGLAQRIGWLHSDEAAQAASAASDGTIYTCAMHPQIRQPAPGRCPICGMALVPAASGVADLDQFSVKIEPAQRRLANIQTAPVQSAPLEETLRTVGVLAVDESRQATIAAYVDGRLERLFADYTGVIIARGDHLAVLYSPQLYAAQVEHLEARRAISNTGGPAIVREAQQALVANTRQRLRELGMTDAQLEEVEASGVAQSRLTIYAPQGGTVVEKLAVEGNYVKAGDPIYRIAELSTVWLMLKLFPEDAARVRFGQRVRAVVQSMPGEVLSGRVAFIDPTVDARTRTVGVRVELLNEKRSLRPGDYAEATISVPIGPTGTVYDADLAGKWISPMHPQIVRDDPGQCPICGMDLVPTAEFGYGDKPVPQKRSLYVPRSAVLLAGGNSVVYVETKPGRFEIRPVTIGPILPDRIVILEGLKAGENVATAGNFLIDSQMQLAGKPSLIDPSRAIAAKKSTEGPLVVEAAAAKPYSGETGDLIESLLRDYVSIQAALAADRQPAETSSQSLHRNAAALGSDAALPADAQERTRQIAAASEHLHHMKLKAARTAFKAISHAVIPLAAQARGEKADTVYTQFYCPMVEGGGGDWLQADTNLLNPYFGAEMLRCGEKVRELPPTRAHRNREGQ